MCIKYKVFKIQSAFSQDLVEKKINALVEEGWDIFFVDQGWIFFKAKEEEGILKSITKGAV